MSLSVKKLLLLVAVMLLYAQPSHAQTKKILAPGTKVILTGGIIPVHLKPDTNSPVVAETLAGIVTKVLMTQKDEQNNTWLYITTTGYGWMQQESEVLEFSTEALSQFVEEQNRIIKDKPQSVEAYLIRGMAYASQENYNAALADYDSAAKLAPEDARIFDFRATITLNNLKKPNSTDSIKDLNEAIRLKRIFASTYNRLGIAYDDDNAVDFAENYYKQAISTLPEWGIPYNNLGTLYRKQKQYQKAITQYNSALKYDPYLAIAYRNRGNAYKLVSEYSKFLDDLNNAIKIDPTCDACYIDLGIYYGDDLHDNESAVEQFTKAIQANPSRARAYANRGESYILTGQPDLALADLKKAVELDPNDSFNQFAIGGLYTYLGMYQEAVDAYTASRKNQDHWGTSSYLYRPQALIALGEYETALTDISSWILSIDTSYDDSYFIAYAYMLRGAIHMYRGEYSEAKQDYQKAYQTNAQFVKSYGTIGSGYWGSLTREGGLDSLEQEMDSKPQESKALLELAHKYMEYGHWSKAVKLYNKAMNLIPDEKLKDVVDYISTFIETP